MYHQTKFSNGLKLITVPVEDAKTAAVLILLPVGSRYESASFNGVSHFIEHMMFKGTVKRPNSLAISRELDGIGAQYNAFTGKDHTGYWVKSAKENLKTGLDVLADMLLNSVFDKKEFQREKGVILEEIKMYQENPLLYIDEFFEFLLFQKHALGQLISGHLENVRKMSHKRLIEYQRLFYRPERVTVVVAGGIKREQTVNLVKKFFPWKCVRKNKEVQYAPFKKRDCQVGLGVKIFYKKDLEQTQIALGGFAYPYNHSKLEAAELLLVILGGNMSSRLFIEVREKRGLAYDVGAYLNKYQDVGNYVIRAGVDKNKVGETIEVILSELEKIKKNGVTKEEILRAKDYLEGRMKISFEDSSALASWYGNQSLFADSIISPAQKLKKIRKVTQGQIQEAALDLFRSKKYKMALIGPFKEIKPLLRILEKRV